MDIKELMKKPDDELTPLDLVRLKYAILGPHPKSANLSAEDLALLPKAELDAIAAAKVKRERVRQRNIRWSRSST